MLDRPESRRTLPVPVLTSFKLSWRTLLCSRTDMSKWTCSPCPPGEVACGQSCCASGLVFSNSQCVCPSGQPMCGTVMSKRDVYRRPVGQVACEQGRCGPNPACSPSSGGLICAPASWVCCPSPSLCCPSTELCLSGRLRQRRKVSRSNSNEPLPWHPRAYLLFGRCAFDSGTLLPSRLALLPRGFSVRVLSDRQHLLPRTELLHSTS